MFLSLISIELNKRKQTEYFLTMDSQNVTNYSLKMQGSQRIIELSIKSFEFEFYFNNKLFEDKKFSVFPDDLVNPTQKCEGSQSIKVY